MPGGLSDGEEVCVIDTPGQTPPGRTPGIHPLGKHPPGADTPAQLHAGIHTPCPIACWDTHPLPHCMLEYTPPYIEGMTHTCENITFLQLLLWRVKYK